MYTSLLVIIIVVSISPSCWVAGVCARIERKADSPFSNLKLSSLSCAVPKPMNEVIN